MKLLLNSTDVALWHDIIQDAEKSCSIVLKEELESYLVFLLMRYMNRPELLSQIMALEFLRATAIASPQQQIVALQEIGDKCLLIAGLYPNCAEKKLVRVSYFVQLGQGAYATISNKNKDLYSLLGTQFVPLMDILQSIRHGDYPELLPLEAYELWSDTGSQRALSILKQYMQANSFTIRDQNSSLFNK